MGEQRSSQIHCQAQGMLPVGDGQIEGGFESRTIQGGEKRTAGRGGEVGCAGWQDFAAALLVAVRVKGQHCAGKFQARNGALTGQVVKTPSFGDIPNGFAPGAGQQSACRFGQLARPGGAANLVIDDS